MVSFTTTLVSLAAALPLAQAIKLNPVSSATTGSNVTVSWTSVDTDPTDFSLYIWNFGVFPPYYEAVAFDVSTAAGSASVRVPCDAPGADSHYQFSAINGTNVYVIYAQTDNFTLTSVPCKDPTAPSCGSLTPTGSVSSNTTIKTSSVAGMGTSTPTTRPSPIATSPAGILGVSWASVVLSSLSYLLAL